MPFQTYLMAHEGFLSFPAVSLHSETGVPLSGTLLKCGKYCWKYFTVGYIDQNRRIVKAEDPEHDGYALQTVIDQSATSPDMHNSSLYS